MKLSLLSPRTARITSMSRAAETVSTKPKILPLFFTQASMNFFIALREADISSLEPGAPGVVP